MYSVLPQKYSYPKGISVSFVFNIIIIFLILQTHGTLFANFSQNKKKIHTVSINKYKLIHKTSTKSSSNENTTTTQKQTIKKTEKPTKNTTKKTQKKTKPSNTTQTLNKEIVQHTDKQTENTSNAKEVISQEITQEKQQENSEENQENQPVNEASYFGLNNEPPLYPIISFQLGESGDVTIEYIVSKEGNIIFAEVIQSSGHLRLDRVAIIEFKRWKFTPAKNFIGEPIDSGKKTITFSFDIKNHGITVK